MATQNGALKRLRPPFGWAIVDGFAFAHPQVHDYFLTHAHADHTTGLSPAFDHGTIYCSSVTSRLLRATIGVDAKRITIIDVGQSLHIRNARVTALDAGHCPGSLLFLFEDLADGTTALHTGDCRASEEVVAAVRDELHRGAPGRQLPLQMDVLYLDTTYCSERWTLPAQRDALRELAAIARREMERESTTLFFIGSYSIGKEKAIRALTEEVGGRALVSSQRALTLRLCGEWDDAIHTEDADAQDVRVRVMPMGGGADAHESLKHALEAHAPKHRAAVSFRPTGWTYARGGASPRVWAENDGATRLYGVPYSEHSSYTELHALVRALRPRAIVPTVNAETRSDRERLVNLFRSSMDLSSDRSRLDWHFARPMAGSSGGESATAAGGGGSASSSSSSGGIASANVSSSVASTRPPVVAMVDLTVDVEDLTEDGVEGAPVPRRGEDDDLTLLPGTVAWVVGKDFKLFKSAKVLQERLAKLGAEVIAAGTRRRKQEVTLIVIPEGSEVGQVPRAACPSARIVHESWVARRSLALRNGITSPPPAPAPAAATAKATTKRRRVDKSFAEKRAARERGPSGAARARMERALSERLYLLERRASSPLRHEFAVLGSTGNVYLVVVEKLPSCTCVDFVERHHICKHLLFVYVKVLGLPRDSPIPLQRALLRSELRQSLHDGPGQPSPGAMASANARAEYQRLAGGPSGEQQLSQQEDSFAEGAAAALVDPRSSDEPCMVCYDALDAESRDDGIQRLLSEASGDSAPPPQAPLTSHCALGCGRIFHVACISRWFEARGAHRSRECPVCRQSWRGDDPHLPHPSVTESPGAQRGGGPPDEGFLNIGALQPGAARVRDTSTYSEWLQVHQRRREQEDIACRGSRGVPEGGRPR